MNKKVPKSTVFAFQPELRKFDYHDVYPTQAPTDRIALCFMVTSSYSELFSGPSLRKMKQS